MVAAATATAVHLPPWLVAAICAPLAALNGRSMLLTLSYSYAAHDLIEKKEIHVDGVEIGPWFTLAQIREMQRGLPGTHFYLHAGNALHGVERKQTAVRRLRAYLQLTNTPWASVHMLLHPPIYSWIAFRWQIELPLLFPDWYARLFVRRMRYAQARLPVPIILENMAAPPQIKPDLIAGARLAFIRFVLRETGMGLLLDLAHARVAAAHLGVDLYDYLRELPLDRVRQLHLSGPRERDGRLADLHQPLQAEDLALLQWVLARCTPQMVTLEYYREEPALIGEQLRQIRAVLPGK